MPTPKVTVSPRSAGRAPDARALVRKPKAKRNFADISAAQRYAILYQLHDAKREETRKRRIEKFVAMLAAREGLG